ncbi:MAG: DUF2115 family protein [Methanomicrobiales archaeon]|nr:DUF2115 family protein [Methanomicrobiales archaeon]
MPGPPGARHLSGEPPVKARNAEHTCPVRERSKDIEDALCSYRLAK